MKANNSKTYRTMTRPHLQLITLATVITYLLVTLGGVVCVTNSSQGCPDWPWCYGKLYPPLRQDSIIEYSHRVVALLTSLLILAAAVTTLLRTPRLRWASIPAALSILFLIAVSVFGALAVLTGLSRGLAALDLGSALLTLALMIISFAAARRYRDYPEARLRFSLKKPFSRLVFWTAIATFVLLVTAVLVTASGSVERCLGFPLFSRALISAGTLGTLQIARRGLAVLVALLIAAVAVQGWHSGDDSAKIRQSVVLLAGALVVELITGVLLLATGFSLILQIVYVTMASAIWALLVSLLMQTSLSAEGNAP